MTDQLPYLLPSDTIADLNGHLHAIQAQAEVSDPRAAMRAVVALSGRALDILNARKPLDPFYLDPALLVPGWMREAGFGKRLANCLHREGYETASQVLRDLRSKPADYWVRLPNFGNSCLQELTAWASKHPAPSLLASIVHDGECLQVDTGLNIDLLPKGSKEREAFREQLAGMYEPVLGEVLGAQLRVIFSDEEPAE